MEDFEVENERNEIEELELVQILFLFLEDDDYEGMYIVRELGFDDGYCYDLLELEDFLQVFDMDDLLFFFFMLLVFDLFLSFFIVFVFDGEEYDDLDEDEVLFVFLEDYNMFGKLYQIFVEFIEF